MRVQRSKDSGRALNGRSCAHVGKHSVKDQCSEFHRVSEGEMRAAHHRLVADSNPAPGSYSLLPFSTAQLLQPAN